MGYLDFARRVLTGLPAAEREGVDGATHCEESEKSAIWSGADVETEWRTVAFRAAIPARGPIWPPRLRETPLCDMPGHYSLCGDALPTQPAPRFPRCAPCVRALWSALNIMREQVPVRQDPTEMGETLAR